jgi:hypothetical protein
LPKKYRDALMPEDMREAKRRIRIQRAIEKLKRKQSNGTLQKKDL